jgi:hypothetical protein
MPWQEDAASYLTAKDADDLWLYREVAVVVARQQGKTTLTKALVLQRLLAGRRIMHIAQVRELPRIMFESLADAIEETHPELLLRRRGKVIWPRRGAGSESIVLTTGAEYRIASALTGGRGFSFDDLLIDELREMESFGVIDAADHAQRFSENPQTVYLSNMGTDRSVILNSLRIRAGVEAPEGSREFGEPDPSLAYLEWSAAPDLPDDAIEGWLQSNPASGHYPQVLRDIEKAYRKAKLGGNMAGFETEVLCRKVPTMRPRLVDDFAWQRAHALKLAPPRRPAFGIAYAPEGRASVVMAWREDAEHVALRELFDVAVDETGIVALGADAVKMARRLGAVAVGYDDATDRDLARQFTAAKGSRLAKATKPVIGQDFQNATAAFVRGLESGHTGGQVLESILADLG